MKRGYIYERMEKRGKLRIKFKLEAPYFLVYKPHHILKKICLKSRSIGFKLRLYAFFFFCLLVELNPGMWVTCKGWLYAGKYCVIFIPQEVRTNA